MEGDWTYNGGHYVHNRGRWAKDRSGRTWVKGNWDQIERGYICHRGHWQ